MPCHCYGQGWTRGFDRISGRLNIRLGYPLYILGMKEQKHFFSFRSSLRPSFLLFCFCVITDLFIVLFLKGLFTHLTWGSTVSSSEMRFTLSVVFFIISIPSTLLGSQFSLQIQDDMGGGAGPRHLQDVRHQHARRQQRKGYTQLIFRGFL